MRDLAGEFETVTADVWVSNEEKWKEDLLKLSDWSTIPLINCNALHALVDGSLVRFRGMVQDMHNAEFYFKKFKVLNKVTNEVKHKTGKYRDTANVMENEEIMYADNFEGAQRDIMVCVTTPGMSDWVQLLEHKQNYLKQLEHPPTSSKRLDSNVNLKRSYNETEDDMEVQNEAVKNMKIGEETCTESNVVSREHLLNFPLPDVQSKSCIVKIYHDKDNIKLNDIVEVVGFLSVDPVLSGEFQPEKNSLLEPQTETAAEKITHNPPPSLVPRLHAVHIKKLEHSNPLVNGAFNEESVLKEATTAREHLKKALVELLLGDDLAAEYLICHLIACVYLRQEPVTLGQFCLNLANLPIEKYPNYGKQLYDIIKQFVTKSYYMPLTVDDLNTAALIPKKDYECNRLTSGILQLSSGTHLVLDETKMQQGTLDNTGVHNVAALGKLIQTQKVEYDFKYYKMDFEADVFVLILSEGKSFLPNDFLLPLRPENSSLEMFNEIIEAANYYLKDDVMNIIRSYLTNIKRVKYTLNENLQFVEDDFLEMRSSADAENPVTADDLHRLLVLARLVGLSRGQNSLNQECWEITKQMEAERVRRVKNREI